MVGSCNWIQRRAPFVIAISAEPLVNGLQAQTDEYIAVVSGLSIGALSPADAQVQMLTEFLAGEIGGPDERQIAAQVSRLVIAGDSLALPNATEVDESDKTSVRT